MSEYVKWCNLVEDLEFGRYSNVSLRVLKYSAKKLSNIPCLFGVKSTVLSTIHFLKVSPIPNCFKNLKGLQRWKGQFSLPDVL